MKRIISIFLAFLMLFSLAACGEQAKEEDPPAAPVDDQEEINPLSRVEGSDADENAGNEEIELDHAKIYPTVLNDEQLLVIHSVAEVEALYAQYEQTMKEEMNYIVQQEDKALVEVLVKSWMESFGSSAKVFGRASGDVFDEYTLILVRYILRPYCDEELFFEASFDKGHLSVKGVSSGMCEAPFPGEEPIYYTLAIWVKRTDIISADIQIGTWSAEMPRHNNAA